MINTKYELLEDDSKFVAGRTLYRIKALRDIGSYVSAGDLGGYIEKESNLSTEGDAWVSGDARVYGNAEVSGNAHVHGNALVRLKTDIFQATGVGTENGTLTVYKAKKGLLVTRGYFLGTPGEFLAKSEKVHDPETHWEYKLLLLVAENRINKGA